MTNDLVERVARAIEQALIADLEVNDHNRKIVARAAIAAMREPTEAMVQRGEEDQYRVEYIWRYMIDAALQEAE